MGIKQMKNKLKTNIALLIAAFAIVVVGMNSMRVAKQNEYHLILRFGRINRIVQEAGIYFKIPFIDTVTVLPKEIILYDIPESDVITSDKKTMIVDEFVLWQITDALKFAQTLNSSIANAEYRINTTVYNATKNVISSTSQEDVISGRDGKLAEMIMAAIGDNLSQYGIEVIAVETKRLDLPDDNKAAVYERMISERETIAAEYTAQGESQAQIIINNTDRTVRIGISDAEADAAVIVAEGEAEYMRILAEAYDTPEKQAFYAFIRALDAAKVSMTDEDILIIDEASPLARIFMEY